MAHLDSEALRAIYACVKTIEVIVHGETIVGRSGLVQFNMAVLSASNKLLSEGALHRDVCLIRSEISVHIGDDCAASEVRHLARYRITNR